MKFKFDFKDGTSEVVEMSDCNSIDDAVNSKCGSNTDGLKGCAIVDDGHPEGRSGEPEAPAEEVTQEAQQEREPEPEHIIHRKKKRH